MGKTLKEVFEELDKLNERVKKLEGRDRCIFCGKENGEHDMHCLGSVLWSEDGKDE